MGTVTDLNIEGLKKIHEGKVRQIYEVDDKRIMLVATDRISAFDVVFKQGIPDKGRMLTEISNHWFKKLGINHHLDETEVENFPKEALPYKDELRGRAVVVKKAKRIDFECIVRGYIIGSGWKDYQRSGAVCGIKLPDGLKLADKFEEPLFTPSTKAEEGEHDENVDFEYMKGKLGAELAEKLKELSINIYKTVRDELEPLGIILADTKFEFGLDENGEPMLIDECCTPDSSRFWDSSSYEPGKNPLSFDKQIFRDYIESSGWDKTPPAPEIPQEIIDKTRKRYADICRLLTGSEY